MCLNKLHSRSPVGQLKQLQQKPFVPSFCTRSGPITYRGLRMLLSWTKNPTTLFLKRTECYRGDLIRLSSDWSGLNVCALLLLSCLIRRKCNVNYPTKLLASSKGMHAATEGSWEINDLRSRCYYNMLRRKPRAFIISFVFNFTNRFYSRL